MIEFLIYFIEYIINPGAVGLSAISVLLGCRNFRKKYIRTSQLDSRWSFAFRVLGIGQIITICLLIVVFVATQGVVLYAASGLVFMNMFVAILVFIFSVFAYPQAKKWVIESTLVRPQIQTTNRDYSVYAYAVIGIIIPITLFVILNGKEVAGRFLERYVIATGNVDLLARGNPRPQDHALYAQLAKDEQNPSICENIELPLYKAQCYEASDPEFPEYEKTCDLYMKQGDKEQADYIQRDCLLSKMYTQLRSKDAVDMLDCTQIASKFGANRQIDRITKECLGIALIQQAVTQNDPSICDIILQTEPPTQYDDVTLKHAACIVHFHGSQTWQKGCDAYQGSISYSGLASCMTETVTPPSTFGMKPYWFQTNQPSLPQERQTIP